MENSIKRHQNQMSPTKNSERDPFSIQPAGDLIQRFMLLLLLLLLAAAVTIRPKKKMLKLLLLLLLCNVP